MHSRYSGRGIAPSDKVRQIASCRPKSLFVGSYRREWKFLPVGHSTWSKAAGENVTPPGSAGWHPRLDVHLVAIDPLLIYENVAEVDPDPQEHPPPLGEVRVPCVRLLLDSYPAGDRIHDAREPRRHAKAGIEVFTD